MKEKIKSFLEKQWFSFLNNKEIEEFLNKSTKIHKFSKEDLEKFSWDQFDECFFLKNKEWTEIWFIIDKYEDVLVMKNLWRDFVFFELESSDQELLNKKIELVKEIQNLLKKEFWIKNLFYYKSSIDWEVCDYSNYKEIRDKDEDSFYESWDLNFVFDKSKFSSFEDYIDKVRSSMNKKQRQHFKKFISKIDEFECIEEDTNEQDIEEFEIFLNQKFTWKYELEFNKKTVNQLKKLNSKKIVLKKNSEILSKLFIVYFNNSIVFYNWIYNNEIENDCIRISFINLIKKIFENNDIIYIDSLEWDFWYKSKLWSSCYKNFRIKS